MAFTKSEEYCAYRHLSEMLDRTGTDWLLSMFELYADDSGTDSSCPLAIAACYISTKRGWDEFVPEWDDISSSEKFSAFHMADFSAHPDLGVKPFCDWDGEKKKRVYRRLARTINENKRAGFGVAIPKDIFDKTVPSLPEPIRRKCGTSHFAFAFKVLLTMIAKWRQASEIKTPMRYVFDRMGKGKGEIIAIWQNLDGNFDNALEKVGMEPQGYSFEDKALFKPLQAADILAWQMNWHMRNVVMAGKRDPEDCHPHFEVLRRDQEMNLAFMSNANFMNTIKWQLDALEQRSKIDDA